MLKAKSSLHYLLPILMTGLVACSGNNSSTTIGAFVVVDPVVVDKDIGLVDWDKNNEVEMASHAYRSIARNSMLATVYSGQSAVFKSFIGLVTGARDQNCNISGSIDADLADKVCSDQGSATIPCTIREDDKEVANPAVKFSSTEQKAVFYQCQNGSTTGVYFNGPLRAVVADDFLTAGIFKNSTTISAVAEIKKQDEKGNFVLNDERQIEKVQVTDFLLQNDLNTILISKDYKLTTQFDNSAERLTKRGISECTTADKLEKDAISGEMVLKRGTSIVTQEELSTAAVAALQAPSPQLSYTEYFDLQLLATKSNFRCEDLNSVNDVIKETLRADTTYSLTTKIASKSLGKNTAMNWEGLVIPSDQKKVAGKITLTHTNSDNLEYEVIVEFDALGNLTVNGGPQMNVQDFLDLSKVANPPAQ